MKIRILILTIFLSFTIIVNGQDRFDILDEKAIARADKNPDRIEREGTDFHQEVRDAYRMLTGKYNWEKIDANGSVDEVFDRIKKIIDIKIVSNS